MSLILEALKKSESQRRLGEAPDLGTPFTTSRRRSSTLPLLLLAIVAAGALGWWFTRTPTAVPSAAAPKAPASLAPATLPRVAAAPRVAALTSAPSFDNVAPPPAGTMQQRTRARRSRDMVGGPLASATAHSGEPPQVVSIAQAPAGPPKPGPEVKKLGVFVGKWTSEMDAKPMPPSPGGKGTGASSCSWIAGGFGVSCTESGDMGAGGKYTDVGMYGYDSETKKYVYSQVSSDGSVIHAHGTVSGDTWTWTADMPMGGKMTHGQFTAKFTSKDAYDMKFEMGPDASSMSVAMTGTATRVKPAAAKPAAK